MASNLTNYNQSKQSKLRKRRSSVAQMDVGETLTVKAAVIREFGYNEETCWGAYLIELETGERVSLNGEFHKALTPELDYEFTGVIGSYKGVNQIRVEHYRTLPPETRQGMITFLKTLPGIKKTALGIYKQFGNEALEMLRNQPEVVVEAVPGLKLKSAKKAQEYLLYEVEGEEVITTLLNYGLSVKDAKRVFKSSGAAILDEIKENPYVLRQKVSGFGFTKCEKLAEEMKFNMRSMYRIQAGILHTLEANTAKGHCFLPIPQLIDESVRLLNRLDCPINHNDLHTSIQDLINRYELILEKQRLYLRKYHEYERRACLELSRLNKSPEQYEMSYVDEALNRVLSRHPEAVLEDKQREAIILSNLKKSGIFILNGHAGTGKTFTLSFIMEVRAELLQMDAKALDEDSSKEAVLEVVETLEDDAESKIELAIQKQPKAKRLRALYLAPTGKASKVMSRATGQPAHTIHRGLHYDATKGEFKFNEKHHLPYDVIICDETSMLDIWLFNQLVQAIKTGAKLIFLGDTHQLPSIGAGNVLKDLLESEIIDGVTLDVVKRQGSQSDILVNANNIIAGLPIENYDRTKDAYFKEFSRVGDIQHRIIESMKELLTRPNFTLDEIQVLSPMRRGPLGTNMLNYLLQEAFNPQEDPLKVLSTTFECREGFHDQTQKYQLFFKTGDKVINVKNMYDVQFCEKIDDGEYEEKEDHEGGITNGECGVIEEIFEEMDEDSEKMIKKIVVKYEEGYVKYEPGDFDSLLHAYCLTVHKSQGSGWKAILFPVHASLEGMLENNLIYTAWTRAREYAECVGTMFTLKKGVQTFRSTVRYTTLAPRAKYEFQKALKEESIA